MSRTLISRRFVFLPFTLALTAALSACGGGGGGGSSSSAASTTSTASSNAVPSNVSGVVAYGHPVSGGDVVAIDINGNKCGSATTGSDGSYSMATTCAPGPVEFAVVSGAPNNIPLVALAISANANAGVSGTVNITPLTTAAVYNFLGSQTILSAVSNPNSFSQVVGFIPTLESSAYQISGTSTAFAEIAAAYQSALNQMLSALSQTLSSYGVNVSSGYDPVATPFTPNGQGIDAFFDAYPESVTGSNNLQLGANGSPILSITFSGSGGATLSVAGNIVSNPTVPSNGSTTTTYSGNYACTAGTYCGAYLGKSVTLSEMVLGPGSSYNAPQYQENCTGTVASSPTTITANPATGPIQVALITGSCTVNGQTTQLYGYVLPNALTSASSQDQISTYDGLGYSGDSSWQPNSMPSNGAVPTSFTLDTTVSLGAVSGSLSIH